MPNVAANPPVVVVTSVVEAALPGVTVQEGALVNAVPKVTEQVVADVYVSFPARSVAPVPRENPVQVAADGAVECPVTIGNPFMLAAPFVSPSQIKFATFGHTAPFVRAMP